MQADDQFSGLMYVHSSPTTKGRFSDNIHPIYKKVCEVSYVSIFPMAFFSIFSKQIMRKKREELCRLLLRMIHSEEGWNLKNVTQFSMHHCPFFKKHLDLNLPFVSVWTWYKRKKLVSSLVLLVVSEITKSSDERFQTFWKLESQTELTHLYTKSISN